MNLMELFVELGFKADTVKLKDFMHAVGDLNLSSISAAVGLGTMYEATHRILGVADETTQSIFAFEQTTGMSGKTMQQFSNYAEQMGASAQDAQSSLKNLQMAMGRVLIGEGNIRPFMLMGIDPSQLRDPLQVLEKVQKFLRESPASDWVKRMTVGELGLSESMIQVLKSSQDLRKSMAELGYVTDAQVNEGVRLHKELKVMGQSWRLVLVDAFHYIYPVLDGLTKLVAGVNHVLHAHKDLRIALLVTGLVATTLFNPFLGILIAIIAATGIIVHKWKQVAGVFSEFYNSHLKPIVDAFKLIAKHIPNLGPESLGAALGNPAWGHKVAVAGSTSVVHNNNIEVSVAGVSDPEAAANIVAKKLQRTLTDYYYHQRSQDR